MKKYGILLLILCVSCGEIKVDSEPANAVGTEVESVGIVNDRNEYFEEISSGIQKFKGKSAKQWKSILKDCFQSNLININDVNYLGASNNIGIGSIVDKKLEFTKRTINSLDLSKSQLSKFMKYGIPSTCEKIDSLDLEINLLFDTNINFGSSKINSEIKSALDQKRNVVFKVESWQKNEIIMNDFIDLLESNPKYKRYLDDMKSKDNRFMNREIVVNGFSSSMNFGSEISANLVTKLVKGIVGKLENGKGDLNFKIDKSNKLTIKSDEQFVLFGKYSKLKGW